jgi:hypothetical protein
LPLFGQPAAAGDSLDFNPTGDFSALSTNSGADLTDGKLSLMVSAKNGYALSSLSFLEHGLASLFKPLDNSDDPFANVIGLVDIDIVEVDGQSIGQLNLPGASMVYTPSNGDYQHSIDAVNPSFSTSWAGQLDVDLAAALLAGNIPFQFGATKVNITLDNTLMASTGQVGSSAFIDKKDFDIIAETVAVPEPTSALLALVALITLGTCTIRHRG